MSGDELDESTATRTGDQKIPTRRGIPVLRDDGDVLGVSNDGDVLGVSVGVGHDRAV